MSVDEGAAGGRIPRSSYSPVHPVISHLPDGSIAIQEKCPGCGRWRIYICEPADVCCDNDHVAAFTPSHDVTDDYPDAKHVATIAARVHHDVAASARLLAASNDARTIAGYD